MRPIVKAFLKITFTLFLSQLIIPVAMAEGDKDLGRFNSWQAHSYKESGQTICNMWSRPKTHAEDGKPRGDIFVYVTHRPKEKRFHEISLDMGYPLKPKSDVVLKIGSKRFKLFVKGQSAFGRSEDDKKIVKSMRAGNSMTITGVSSKGTKTKDSYSLKGFSKANNAANKACGTKKPK